MTDTRTHVPTVQQRLYDTDRLVDREDGRSYAQGVVQDTVRPSTAPVQGSGEHNAQLAEQQQAVVAQPVASVLSPQPRPNARRSPHGVSMATAKVEAKAQRLLIAGRVRVQVRDFSQLMFSVVGDSGTYDVVRRPGSWTCSCPCYGRCSHLEACMRVAS